MLRIASPPPAALALGLSLALAGCASSREEAGFPSLAQRAIETRSDAITTPPPAMPGPADAALVGRIATLDADAERAAAVFAQTLERSRPRIAAAGTLTFGSDGWIAAQNAYSDLDAARRASWDALNALDALVAERTIAGTTDGLAEIEAARARAAERVSAQEIALAPLREAMNR